MSEKLILSQARACIRAKTLRLRSNKRDFASKRRSTAGPYDCTFVQ